MRTRRDVQTIAVLATSRVRRAIALAAAACSVLVLAACSGDSTGPDDTTPVGNYGLTSVNGKSLPATIFSDTNYLVVVTSGSLSLTADGKYNVISTTKETVLNNTSTYVDSSSGTWVQGTTAKTLTFTDQYDGTKVNATWGGGKITASDTTAGTTMTVVYTRK